MCGIAGVFEVGTQPGREAVEPMVNALMHRGPDGSGFWSGEDVALGMRRLAIVDVEHGKQPLSNEDETIQVVFNGEIYNHTELRVWLGARGHRLRTATDGEVIAHLWEEVGERFCEHLNGIFAIALWDSRRRVLVLARDHLGVKPLYYKLSNSGLRFASEVKALLRSDPGPRHLDLETVDAFLSLRFTPPERTLLAEVNKLAPATCLVADGEGVRSFRYWQPAPQLRTDLSLSEAADEFRGRLRVAVRRQMMSDRPIGLMLSGGIDSAAVMALMAETSGQVRTYTVGFEGGGDADETALARESAASFGTDHRDLIVPAGDFREQLTATVGMLEEPVGTSSALGFRAVARLARADVPVLLSGQGADELLAGYWRYVGEWLASNLLSLTRRRALRRPLSWLAGRSRSARFERGLRALRYPDTLERFMQIYAVFNPAAKRTLYTPETSAVLSGHPSLAARAVAEHLAVAASRDPLAQMMYVDTRLWLPEDLLLVGDKMSMAESVEMRVPFLDRDLVEFVESLPTNFKLRRGTRKLVHKLAMQPLLPRKTIHRKERGFATPVDRWLRSSDLFGFAGEVMLDPGAKAMSHFERRELERLLHRHRDGVADHTRQLYCLLSLELWARQFL